MPAKSFFVKYYCYCLIFTSILALGLFTLYFIHLTRSRSQTYALTENLASYQKQLSSKEKELTALKNQDQYKRNETLQSQIKAIQTTYSKAVKLYEQIEDVRAQKQPTESYEKQFAQALHFLSEKKYASADATLTTLTAQLQKDQQKISQTVTSTNQAAQANVPVNNSAPGSGYSRQTVHSDIGDFTVDIIAADLGSTRVIVDTASDSDCHDNCPVLPLNSYVSRSGAYAGINGSYFCPASYPSCAGKTNSFDTLLMNKNKVYFNSDNNIYSTVPVAVFGNNFSRFLGASSGWGRDTGVDAVIANQPLLLSGGNIVFNGDGDPKKGSKGSRSFIGTKGNTVYIGVIQNVTVAEGAHVLKALGLENALNLDSGGSTALWYGGYKAGPGRNIPNAILFVRK